jgi:hypothetical protein
MSLNTLELSDRLLADLYKNHLIGSTGVLSPKPAGASANKISFLGNNRSNTAVFVKYPQQTWLPDEDLQFLIKMLAACKMTLTDVAIINISKQQVRFNDLQDFAPKYVLLMGVEPSELELPMNFPAFKLQSYAGSTYLLSAPIHEINQDSTAGKTLKMQIWNCLKQMFEVHR